MREIYVGGLISGTKPLTTDYEKLREEARQKLDPRAYAYVAGSAGYEATEKSNRRALDSFQIGALVACWLLR